MNRLSPVGSVPVYVTTRTVVAPSGETGCAVIVYVPTGTVSVWLVVSAVLYPPGPTTVTDAASPPGSPAMFTVSSPVAWEYVTDTGTATVDAFTMTPWLAGVGTQVGALPTGAAETW